MSLVLLTSSILWDVFWMPVSDSIWMCAETLMLHFIFKDELRTFFPTKANT